jgi:putative ABC transport system substrate-binding protein
MNRRDFITLLGGAAAAWPIMTRAQQPAMPVIGFLDNTALAVTSDRVSAFLQGLNSTGFVEARNVQVEWRWAEGRLDRLSALAADLVQRQVSVIVTNNQAAPAVKAATSTIPIVLITGADPVQDGLVSSLDHPGANITGVSYSTGPLNQKRLELLHELVPKPAVIAALLDPSAATFDTQLRDMEEAGRALGRQILIVKAKDEREFDPAFKAMVEAHAGALFIGSGAFYRGEFRQLVVRAARYALPVSCPTREFVLAGGLMSYGASDTDAYRRGGIYVGRILKGTKPGDLPIELPTKYELVVNLATAKALGLDVPASLLARADEVIE